ncbi:uncharacterized protein METZ01_LOCUS449135, partial [marine metagenome]
PDSLLGGIANDHAVLIKNTFPSLGNKADSYFAYEKMEMFVHGGDPTFDSRCNWCTVDSSEVDLLFRIGKDDKNYYEIHQPVYEGWNDRNHIDINIDKLTQLKIPTTESPAEKLSDVGLDGCTNSIENGYGGCLDTLTFINPDTVLTLITFSDYCNNEILSPDTLGNYITFENCTDFISDPNNDNFDDNPNGTEDNDRFDYKDINGDGLITAGEGELAIEDFNGDGIYTVHPTYDYNNKLYVWNNPEDISTTCHHCR